MARKKKKLVPVSKEQQELIDILLEESGSSIDYSMPTPLYEYVIDFAKGLDSYKNAKVKTKVLNNYIRDSFKVYSHLEKQILDKDYDNPPWIRFAFDALEILLGDSDRVTEITAMLSNIDDISTHINSNRKIGKEKLLDRTLKSKKGKKRTVYRSKVLDNLLGENIKPITANKLGFQNKWSANVYKINPLIIKSEERTSVVSEKTKTMLKQLRDQKLWGINNYQIGHPVIYKYYETAQTYKLLSEEELRPQVIKKHLGKNHRSIKDVTTDDIENAFDNYRKAKKNWSNIRSYHKTNNNDRIYAPFVFMTSMIRPFLNAHNGYTEQDYKSLHPNLLMSIYTRKINLRAFEKVDKRMHAWLIGIQRNIPSVIKDSEMEFILSVMGDVKTNLATETDSNVDDIKIESLSYYNTTIGMMPNYKTINEIFADYAPKFIRFIKKVKENSPIGHRAISRLLFALESMVMEYNTMKCIDAGVDRIMGVHDALCVQEKGAGTVKSIMNATAKQFNIGTFVK